MTAHRLNKGLARCGDIRNSQGPASISWALLPGRSTSCDPALPRRLARRFASLLLPETTAIAVAMTDTERVLAYEGALAADFPPGSPIHTAGTLEVLKTGNPGMFQSRNEDDNTELPRSVRGGIVVPLNVQDRVCGTIKFYYRSPADINRSQLAIARGSGQLLSTQLSTHELDRQAELTAKAEVKALQRADRTRTFCSTPSTPSRRSRARTRHVHAISCVSSRSSITSDARRASDQLIPLARELEQTRRYLRFEPARTGEDRISEHEHVGFGCGDVLVPAFIVQPIVENAVRHAMRDEGALNIDIRAEIDGSDVLIAVTDDGLGMDEETLEKLRCSISRDQPCGCSREEKGTGIALRNVAERLERFYGFDSGIDIMSKPGEGTCVTLRLARTAAHD